MKIGIGFVIILLLTSTITAANSESNSYTTLCSVNSPSSWGNTTISALPLCDHPDDYLVHNISCYPYCTVDNATCIEGVFDNQTCACVIEPANSENYLLIFALVFLIVLVVLALTLWKFGKDLYAFLHDTLHGARAKICAFQKQISLWALLLLVIAPLVASITIFVYNPEITYSTSIATIQSQDAQSPQIIINGNATANDAKQPDLFDWIKELFNTPPGFSWYGICFEDTTRFEPPAIVGQNVSWQLDSGDGNTYHIPPPGSPRFCVPFRIDKPFTARYHAGGSDVTLLPGQSITYSAPKITYDIELGSVLARILLFIIAWDALVILIYEGRDRIFKK